MSRVQTNSQCCGLKPWVRGGAPTVQRMQEGNLDSGECRDRQMSSPLDDSVFRDPGIWNPPKESILNFVCFFLVLASACLPFGGKRF